MTRNNKMSDKQRKGFFARLKQFKTKITSQVKARQKKRFALEAKRLESEETQLLKKIDAEEQTVARLDSIQKKVNANKALKQHLRELKQQEFAQTRTGRALTFVSQKTQAFGKTTQAKSKIKKAAKKLSALILGRR